jgi:hypothetical protein
MKIFTDDNLYSAGVRIGYPLNVIQTRYWFPIPLGVMAEAPVQIVEFHCAYVAETDLT